MLSPLRITKGDKSMIPNGETSSLTYGNSDSSSKPLSSTSSVGANQSQESKKSLTNSPKLSNNGRESRFLQPQRWPKVSSQSNSSETSQENNQSIRKQQELVGECMLELLEGSSLFQEHRQQYSLGSNKDPKVNTEQRSFQLSPLISRHNIAVLRHILSHFLTKKYTPDDNIQNETHDYTQRSIFRSVLHYLTSVANLLYQDRYRPDLKSFLFFTMARLFPISLFTLALLGNCFIIFSMYHIALMISYVTFCIVDKGDVYYFYNTKCPGFVKLIGKLIWETWHLFDSYVLLGNRYIGREWDKREFCWTAHNTENTFVWWSQGRPTPAALSSTESSRIMDFPPPSVTSLVLKNKKNDSKGDKSKNLELCLDRDFLKKQENNWTDATIDHIAAIDYCYLMMKEQAGQGKTTKSPRRKKNVENRRDLLQRSQSSPVTANLLEEEFDIGKFSINKEPFPTPVSSDMMQSDDEETTRTPSKVKPNGGRKTMRCDSEVISVISKNQRFAATQNDATRNIFDAPGSPRESIELKVRKVINESSFCSDEEHDHSFNRFNSSTELLPLEENQSEREECDAHSVASHTSDADLPWLDVGVKVGMRLLNSAHVQRAMASHETADRILGIGANFGAVGEGSESNASASTVNKNDVTALLKEIKQTGSTDVANKKLDASRGVPEKPIPRPVHPMWTSPSAAGSAIANRSCSLEIEDEIPPSPINRSRSFNSYQNKERTLPPRSPRPCSLGRLHSSRPITSSLHSVQNLESENISKSNDNDIAQKENAVEISLTDPLIPRVVSKASCDILGPLPDAVNTESRFDACSDMHQHQNQTTRKETDTKEKSNKSRIEMNYRRAPLKPGVKVAVPLSPSHPHQKSGTSNSHAFVMATVISSNRIFVAEKDSNSRIRKQSDTNCLSVTVKMEQFFLRNGEFAELTFRVMDDWGPCYMPRHSKVPIGSCVATSFGIGVLVGWRVEDDCHVVRSLWKRRGAGTAHAYLNRQAIHSTIEAAVGFRVQTAYGWGEVLGCTEGESTFKNCRFYVAIKEEGRHKGNVLQLNRKDIVSCHGAQFIPVIEHVREAANYQLQIDNYYAALREQRLDANDSTPEQELLREWTIWVEILWASFLKAVEENKDFDSSVNGIMDTIVEFLDKLDKPTAETNVAETDVACHKSDFAEIEHASESNDSKSSYEAQEPGFWIMNDLFGGIFTAKKREKMKAEPAQPKPTGDEKRIKDAGKSKYYDRAFGILRILMKTVSIARASSVEHPHLRLGLAIGYELLLFLRTVIKVQQQNISVQSLDVWKRAWEEIVITFGPLKERLEKIGRGIAQRMQAQGRKAKVRVLKFVDTILGDERLLIAMEQGDWDRCLARLEIAFVEAHVIESDNLVYYRKAAKFLYDHIQVALASEGSAAARNTEKLALLAKFVQSIASPRRTILKFICQDDVLELFERILVRAYYKEKVATRMLTIHAANFHSLRHLRMLKDFSVAGRIWIPLLDAADEEISWLVSKLPENSKDLMCPLSSLFSLCVVQFHKINAGDLSKDWLAFLLEEDSARIIHDIDVKLILALESFSRDIREMMVVLPYYSSIDDDILNLMDEVDFDELLKEVSDAIDDPDKLSQFLHEKAIIAIERFLNYLPKMSIPVEKRDLGDGWVLTCQGEDGGDLTLSDVNIRRENLVCRVMGGDSLFFPMFSDEDSESQAVVANDMMSFSEENLTGPPEESILDHIRELIINAQAHGCWKSGVGGVGEPPTDRYVSKALHGLPVSSVLNCAIELWRNLELDDDELLEIAIRDISYQIQLQKEREEGFAPPDLTGPRGRSDSLPRGVSPSSSFCSNEGNILISRSSDLSRHRFNPRVDPTVLHLEIKSLKLNLNNFLFRIEKNEKKTIFDPVFEGKGMVSLENVSIRLRIECAKEKLKAPGPHIDVSTPILQLKELEVVLEKLKMKVKDTGFGSDWILNKAVDVFEEKITKVVEENLKEQINTQVQIALENLNSYFLVNPNILLNILGISMEDLDDNVVWV